MRNVEGSRFHYCGHHRHARGDRERRFVRDLAQYRRELSQWEEAQNHVAQLVAEYRSEALEALESVTVHELDLTQQRLLWLAGPVLARHHPHREHRLLAWVALAEQGCYEVDEGTLSIDRLSSAAATRVPRPTEDDAMTAAERWLERVSEGAIDRLGLGLSPSWQRRVIHAGEPLVKVLSLHRGPLDDSLLSAVTRIARDLRHLPAVEQERRLVERLAELRCGAKTT